jgi:hypothetical protein
MFTTLLLLQLEEADILSLDDPLSRWLPDWAQKIPYGKEITLRQLANHTAGLWDYADDIIGGGLAALYLTMASYFFSEENPFRFIGKIQRSMIRRKASTCWKSQTSKRSAHQIRISILMAT